MMGVYEDLHAAYKKANPRLGGQTIQENVNVIWRVAKQRFTSPAERDRHIRDKIQELLQKATQEKAATVLNFFKVSLNGSLSSIRSCLVCFRADTTGVS